MIELGEITQMWGKGVKEAVSIGMIGDYDAAYPAHKAVIAALDHAADYLSVKLNVCWLPTESMLESQYQRELEQYAGLWAAPGSPYQSMDGALRGIQYAREMNRPFLGT
jgi:CTP synthase (UTP-ammonia lyase)